MEQTTYAGFECGVEHFRVGFEWSPVRPWEVAVSLSGHVWYLSTEWLLTIIKGEEWDAPIGDIDIALEGNSYISLAWPKAKSSPVAYVYIGNMSAFWEHVQSSWPDREITDEEIQNFIAGTSRT